MCETKDVCPKWNDPDSGFEADAAACTVDALVPDGFELAHGKRLSCDCSGADGDWSTAWACNQQPYTHWVADLQQSNATGVPSSVFRYAEMAQAASCHTIRMHNAGFSKFAELLGCFQLEKPLIGNI